MQPDDYLNKSEQAATLKNIQVLVMSLVLFDLTSFIKL